jgi:uridine kinase
MEGGRRSVRRPTRRWRQLLSSRTDDTGPPLPGRAGQQPGGVAGIPAGGGQPRSASSPSPTRWAGASTAPPRRSCWPRWSRSFSRTPASRSSTPWAPASTASSNSNGVEGITRRPARGGRAAHARAGGAGHAGRAAQGELRGGREAFEAQGQADKVNLLRFRNPPKVVICTSATASATSRRAPGRLRGRHHPLRPDPARAGFVIQFPDRSIPPRIPSLRQEPQLFQIFQEHKKWGRILNVNTVGRLNEIIATNESRRLHPHRGGASTRRRSRKIADHVFATKRPIRWLLIAGPSSSGKTTFAKRLEMHLRVNGLRCVTPGVDNYFVTATTPRKDANGDHDFEHIEAIDLEAAQRAPAATWTRARRSTIPTFNFQQGLKEFKGDKLKLAPDQIVILEGIHCLNPRLTERPRRSKVQDLHQRADPAQRSTTTTASPPPTRLVRRMVRDYQFRGHSALVTMNMWPSVRAARRSGSSRSRRRPTSPSTPPSITSWPC